MNQGRETTASYIHRGYIDEYGGGGGGGGEAQPGVTNAQLYVQLLPHGLDLRRMNISCV